MKKTAIILMLFFNVHVFAEFHLHMHDLEMVNGIISMIEGMHSYDYEGHDHEEVHCFICDMSKQVKLFPRSYKFSLPLQDCEKKVYFITYKSVRSQNIRSSTLSRAPPLA